MNVKTVNNVLSFTISSSQRGEQSHVTDTVMKLVCVWTQSVIKMISDGLYTPLWCDPISLSLSNTNTQATIKTISEGLFTPLWCDPLYLSLSLSNTNRQSTIKTISEGLYTPLWCDPVYLSLSHTQTHKPWLRRFLKGCTLRYDVTLSISLSLSHTSHD